MMDADDKALRKLLFEFVDMYSNVQDIQFNRYYKPPLWFMPLNSDEKKMEAAHYFLLAASINETKLVGNARNVRIILNYLYRKLGDKKLYSSQDANDFENAVKSCESECKRFGKFGEEKDKIPSILAHVNKFVNNKAGGNLIKYAENMRLAGKKPEDIVNELGYIGARLGGRHKAKAWLYMRWMVRGKPDLGLFSFSPEDLLIPLTRPTLRVAIALELADRSCREGLRSDEWWNDFDSVRDVSVKLTEYVKSELFPQDPAKADYPFFILGRWLEDLELTRETLLKSLKFFTEKRKEFGKPPIYLTVQMEHATPEIGAFGSLEKFVADKLREKNLAFEYEPLEFRLPSFRELYPPDFILRGKTIDGKKVILEPHGKWKGTERRKFSLFKKIYGEYFIFILIVPDNRFQEIKQKIPPEIGAYDYIWRKYDFPTKLDHLLKVEYDCLC